MKSFFRLLCLTGLITSACTLDSLDEKSSAINDNDIHIVGQIVAESLSDQDSGIMTSLFDAFEIPTSDGFRKIETPEEFGLLSENAWLQNIANYTYSYDPATGVHATSYSIEVNQGDTIQRTMHAELEYIYYDFNGNFMQDPTYDRISTVSYSGLRTGNIVNASKNSTYLRQDEFIIDGFSSNLLTVKVDGDHRSEGYIRGYMPDGSAFERQYTISFDFLDIQIDKTTIEDFTNLEQGVSGAIGYSLTMDEHGATRAASGTVQVSGDGTAMLKFKGASKIVTLQLNEGRQLDSDEFQGRIESINAQSGVITLANKQRIRINNETLIDSEGDYPTLEKALEALSQGIRITASGKANRIGQSLNFEATEASFSKEVPDTSSMDNLSFSGNVQSVNLQRQTFNLPKGNKVRINDDTVFSESGDLHSLEDMRDAIRAKQNVTVNGEGIQDPENRRVILAYNLVVIVGED